MLVAARGCHAATLCLKLVAPLKIELKSVTPVTSQPLTAWLNDVAPANIDERFVARAKDHFVPEAARGFEAKLPESPLLKAVAPENMELKFVTEAVFQELTF